MTRICFPAACAALFALATVGCTGPPRVVGELELEPNPSGHAPLAALLRFTTDQPARVRLAIDNGDGVTEVTPSEAFATGHAVPVLGVRAGRANTITVTLESEAGKTTTAEPVTFDAPPIPESFPPIEVLISRPAQMEPGVTLVPLFRWSGNTPLPDDDYGLLVAVDAEGEIVWYYETDSPIDEARPAGNGNFRYNSDLDGRIFEVDMLGNVVRRWHTTGIPKEDIPDTSIPVEAETVHHDFTEMASGNLLALSTEVRRMDWPDGPMPGAELAERNVIGDRLIEIRPDDGSIVREWKFFDIFDVGRKGFGSFSTGFYQQAYEKVLDEPGYDWMHTNSLFYLADEDAVITSSPNMCAISKLDLATGTIEWILGLPDGWQAPWSDLLLAPDGDIDWFCSQHAAEITPRGTLLIYDNARPGFPGYEPTPDDDNYSRAVEFAIDEQAGTVRQVWSFGGPGEGRFFAPFISEADSLPVTGNVLLANGGQMSDANGKPTSNFGAGHHWTSIVEVTHETPAEKVWEIVIDDPRGGWASYRAERIASLYPELR